MSRSISNSFDNSEANKHRAACCWIQREICLHALYDAPHVTAILAVDEELAWDRTNPIEAELYLRGVLGNSGLVLSLRQVGRSVDNRSYFVRDHCCPCGRACFVHMNCLRHFNRHDNVSPNQQNDGFFATPDWQEYSPITIKIYPVDWCVIMTRPQILSNVFRGRPQMSSLGLRRAASKRAGNLT